MENTAIRTTLPKSPASATRLDATSVDELQRLVQSALADGKQLYPISRGRNWGYGDACPVLDGQVVVDLSGLDRILEVNERLAYAVIEPGVTQGQLQAHLAQHYPSLWLDVTGAGPEASVLGNTLERGFGHTPLGDHFAASAGYEVLLADGRLLNTGFGRFENCPSAYLFKPGLGPALDGLFTQSNFGIVTKMGVWLLPKPEALAGFAFSVPERDDVAPLVEALRPLRLSGTLTSTIHIANDLRVLSSKRRYPWDMLDGTVSLPAEIRSAWRREAGIGAWNVLGGIYGTRESVAASRRALARAMRGLARVHFFDETKLSRAERLLRLARSAGLGARLGKVLEAVRPAFSLLKGEPVDNYLEGSGWRSRKPPLPGNLDPLQNGWGFSWVSPIVPMTGEHCLTSVNLMESIFAEHGFEPLMTLASVNPRALCCVTTVSFDKSNPAECERGAKCHKALLDALVRAGYPPYRVGIQSMEYAYRRGSVFCEVVQAIKKALDPQNVISPGRYVAPEKSE